MIPLVATIRLRHGDGTGFRLWIPLFLVWALVLPVGLVLFPVVLLVCFCVRVSVIGLYVTGWRVLNSMRNLLVDVESQDVSIRLRIV